MEKICDRIGILNEGSLIVSETIADIKKHYRKDVLLVELAICFIKKECMEQTPTYKTLIMLAVFFLFGMMSPLLARLMPGLCRVQPYKE